MAGQGTSFKVGDWLVEPALNRVSQGTKEVLVRPQVMDALVYLAEHQGKVVTADELMEQVWNGVIVGSGSVYNCINELRKAFDDDPNQPQYVETISKRGYRLLAAVEPLRKTSLAGLNWSRAGLVAGLLALVILIALSSFDAPQTATAERDSPGELTIAVLPFADLSPESDQAYFADGITEELLNTLARIESLQVAARTSSFHFRNKEPTIAEVGQTLGVAYVVEGSVRKDQGRVRVTAQLIEVEGGYHLWSQNFDRELVDVFAIQDEISHAIVESLLDEIELAARTDARADVPGDMDAYNELLLGLQLLNRRTPEDLISAQSHFGKAIEIDENYAAAHANLATSYWLLHVYDRDTAAAAFEKAWPHAQRALALNPESAQVHAAMFFMEDLQGYSDPEFQHLNRALELNPSYADAHNWKANMLEEWREYRQAEIQMKRGLEIDPLSAVTISHLVINLLRSGRRKEAEMYADRLISLDVGWGMRRIASLDYDRGDHVAAAGRYLEGLARAPKHFGLLKGFSELLAELELGEEAGRLYPNDRSAHQNHRYKMQWDEAIETAQNALDSGDDKTYFQPALAEAYYFAGQLEAAVSAYQKVLPASNESGYQEPGMGPFGYIFLAHALQERGDSAAAQDFLFEVLDDIGRQQEAGYSDGQFHQLLGLTRVFQGREEEALDALELAFDSGFRQGWVLEAPLLKSLGNEPRFHELKRRYQAAGAANQRGVLALICGEDRPSIGWEPLIETCQGSVTLAIKPEDESG